VPEAECALKEKLQPSCEEAVEDRTLLWKQMEKSEKMQRADAGKLQIQVAMPKEQEQADRHRIRVSA